SADWIVGKERRSEIIYSLLDELLRLQRQRSEVAVGTRISPRPPHIYGPAARCKRINWMGACGPLQSIRPLVGACAPGHHGNPRAAVLIRSKASRAMCGARFQLRRGDRCSIVLTFSREPRQGSSRFTSGSQPQPSCRFWHRCGIVSASMIEYRPRDARELVGQRYGKDVFMKSL